MTKQDVELIRSCLHETLSAYADLGEGSGPEAKAISDLLSRLDQIADDAQVGRAVSNGVKDGGFSIYAEKSGNIVVEMFPMDVFSGATPLLALDAAGLVKED